MLNAEVFQPQRTLRHGAERTGIIKLILFYLVTPRVDTTLLQSNLILSILLIHVPSGSLNLSYLNIAELNRCPF